VNRFRFSNNREYYFETDYLAEKQAYQFPGYRILALQPDGSWKEIGSTKTAKQLLASKPKIKEASEQLHQLIVALSEEGPRVSFIGRFIKPVTTRVFLRGSPETTGDEVVLAAVSILDGDLEMDSSTPDPERRKRFAACRS